MKIERIDITATDYGEVVGATLTVDKSEVDEICDNYIVFKGVKYPKRYNSDAPVLDAKLIRDLREKYEKQSTAESKEK